MMQQICFEECEGKRIAKFFMPTTDTMFLVYEDATFSFMKAKVYRCWEDVDAMLEEDNLGLLDYPTHFVKLGIATQEEVDAEKAASKERERRNKEESDKKKRRDEIAELARLKAKYEKTDG